MTQHVHKGKSSDYMAKYHPIYSGAFFSEKDLFWRFMRSSVTQAHTDHCWICSMHVTLWPKREHG